MPERRFHLFVSEMDSTQLNTFASPSAGGVIRSCHSGDEETAAARGSLGQVLIPL